MTDAVAHRGPDGEGISSTAASGWATAGWRSSICRRAGRQPMADRGRPLRHLIYNGEIYNFRELRVELEARGLQFRSRTDTEVIVHAYEQWGEAASTRLNGMFAFAIWDRPRRGELFLARDRYGVKPLYYWQSGTTLLFASEIKTLPAASARSPRRDLPGPRSSTSRSRTSSAIGRCSTAFACCREAPP